MLRKTELAAEILAADGNCICSSAFIAMQAGVRGSQESDVWRGAFHRQHCDRLPQVGETLILRLINTVELHVAVTTITAELVHFRTRMSPFPKDAT